MGARGAGSCTDGASTNVHAARYIPSGRHALCTLCTCTYLCTYTCPAELPLTTPSLGRHPTARGTDTCRRASIDARTRHCAHSSTQRFTKHKSPKQGHIKDPAHKHAACDELRSANKQRQRRRTAPAVGPGACIVPSPGKASQYIHCLKDARAEQPMSRRRSAATMLFCPRRPHTMLAAALRACASAGTHQQALKGLFLVCGQLRRELHLYVYVQVAVQACCSL